MLHQFRRELHAFQYILARERRVLLQDIFNRISRGEKLQDSLCRDPCVFDHGLSVADIWVDDDAAHKTKCSTRIANRECKGKGLRAKGRSQRSEVGDQKQRELRIANSRSVEQSVG